MFAMSLIVARGNMDVGAAFVLFPIFAGIVILNIVIWCKIFSRAGYGWAMGLLMLIPPVNFIMMLVLAFSEWPIQREVNALRQVAGRPAGPLRS